MRDYNNELETILDKKLFPVEVKNILLSMFYKINTAYNDYSVVKRNVEDKKEYMESLINTIDTCNNITLIKPNEDDKEKMNIYTTFNTDYAKRNIEVYPNEKTMLYALNDLNYTKMYLKDSYGLIKNSFPYVINKGREIDSTEIIRDFDAWTWNTQVDEISSLEANLLFQNLQMLLGYRRWQELLNLKAVKSDLNILEKNLEKLYGKDLSSKLLRNIYKISIILLINEDNKEKDRLKREKEWMEAEYNKINDKKEYVENITSIKKKINKKIKDIDIILNNDKLLLEEFEKRNQKLSKQSKIFSLSHLNEILIRERDNEIKKLNEYNSKIDPKKYTEGKIKLEKEYKMLKNIDFTSDNKVLLRRYMLNAQKIFIECFKKQIKEADNKKQLMYLIYVFRYYKFIPFSKKTFIKDEKVLKEIIKEAEKMLIEKMDEFKMINKYADDFIIYKVFETKIFVLEDIQFELKKEKDDSSVMLNFYDENIVSDSFKIDNLEVQKLKFNKKHKIFI